MLPLITGDEEVYQATRPDHFGELSWDPGNTMATVYSVARDSFKYIETTPADLTGESTVALYNLREDPVEKIDVAGNYPGLTRELASALHYYRAVCDSLAVDIEPFERRRLSKEEVERLRALGYVD